jgi:hypothetical protein
VVCPGVGAAEVTGLWQMAKPSDNRSPPSRAVPATAPPGNRLRRDGLCATLRISTGLTPCEPCSGEKPPIRSAGEMRSRQRQDGEIGAGSGHEKARADQR